MDKFLVPVVNLFTAIVKAVAERKKRKAEEKKKNG